MSKKKFTLIELIVVIAVLGILASIVVPNIQNVQSKATQTAITSNQKSLQTAIDMYRMDHFGELPSQIEPEIGKPQTLDFSALYPKYIRNLPKVKDIKYWVDYQGQVWNSTSDSPTGINYSSQTMNWNEVHKAVSYNVYDMTSKVTSAVSSTGKLTFLLNSKTNNITVPEGKTYAISSIDSNGLESAPVIQGYVGYQNQKPVAVINMNPSENIKTDTTVAWDYSSSFDPDGDEIVNAEWEGKQNVYSTAGSYTIKLRVQDNNGLWSDWTEKTINVSLGNSKPTAVITMNPNSNIANNTIITWNYSSSTDPDGDAISVAEWQLDSNPITSNPNGVISVIGSHTMKLRVQDARGLWSEWTEQAFNVIAGNNKPTAVITMNPSSNIMTNTNITWSYNSSTDPDGDSISKGEWQLDSNPVTTTPNGVINTIGSHTMQLRVQDSRGLWSDWATKTFTVAESTGSGTTSDPYIIRTADQLNAMRGGITTGWDLTKSYKLASDINLSTYTDWEPIGNSTTPFKGNLDGDNHKIINLKSNKTTVGNVALIGQTSSTTTISNLGIENANIYGVYNVGGIVGNNLGIVTNVYVKGTIKGSSSVGGIIGNNYGQLINSYVEANVYNTGGNTGGLVGMNNGGSIKTSYSKGYVEGVTNVGGIIGYQMSSSNGVVNAYSTSNVKGTEYVGGIVGWNGSGSNAVPVQFTYSTGVIEGKDFVGGIAGRINNNNSENNKVIQSFALNSEIKRTTGSTGVNFRRVVGVQNGGQISNLYGNSSMKFTDITRTATSNASGEDGLNITLDTAKTSSPYVGQGWDFTNTWKMVAGSDYPRLKWEN